MKILFYNHTGKVSGAEQMLLITLAGIDRKKFESLVLCPEDGPLTGMLKAKGFKTEVTPTLEARFTLRPDRLAKYLVSSLKVVRAVRSTVKGSDPDLVHANSIRAGLVATAATLGLGTKVIWHLHDILPSHPVSAMIRIIAFFFARAQMIAVSGAVAENFAGKFFSIRNRTTVILNGIDVERFKPVEGRRQETRRQLELQDSDFVVGIVGMLTPRKGQLELIRSFAGVIEDVPNAWLLVVGSAVFNKDHEYTEELKRTVLQLGLASRVSFLGTRDDIPEIMQSLDLLVVNSKVEPCGLVVIEGLASGTPVVAAASGGIPEIIEHKKSGWLVDQGNEATLTATIVSIAKSRSRREQLAKSGQERALAFTSTRYIKDLEAFYLTTNTDRDAPCDHDTTVAPQAA